MSGYCTPQISAAEIAVAIFTKRHARVGGLGDGVMLFCRRIVFRQH